MCCPNIISVPSCKVKMSVRFPELCRISMPESRRASVPAEEFNLGYSILGARHVQWVPGAFRACKFPTHGLTRELVIPGNSRIPRSCMQHPTPRKSGEEKSFSALICSLPCRNQFIHIFLLFSNYFLNIRLVRTCHAPASFANLSYPATPAETVRLQYVLNMLVIACCETTLKTTQRISYHSQKTSAILR
jgi:hypothetical protein